MSGLSWTLKLYLGFSFVKSSNNSEQNNNDIINTELDIQKLQNRDHKEISLMARTISCWVYNVVLSYLQNNEEAEEVVQDTIMAALKGLDNFKNESMLKTWVYAIAINKSKDVIKYKSRKKRSGKVISIHQQADTDKLPYEPTNFSHPGIELENKESMEMLFEGINNLPNKQKEALILAKLDGMPVKEIAGVMSTTPKAVESLLSRARSNFRSYLTQNNIHI